MAILLLTSTGGAPGVTTAAVGLALTWPRPVLLADCDPGAHQAVLAGYLTGQAADGKGLIRVAEAQRDRRSLREVVIDQSLALSDDALVSRRFLPGFAKPSSAAHFGGVWEELAATFDRLDEVGIDVLIDAGRVGAGGLPGSLLERSALTLVVLRSSLRAVVSARVHLAVLRDQAARTSDDSARFGLLVVGEGRPYGRGEIASALGTPVIADLAYDPVPAAHLSDGQPRPRRFDHSPLTRSLRATAASLAERLQRSSDLVRT